INPSLTGRDILEAKIRHNSRSTKYRACSPCQYPDVGRTATSIGLSSHSPCVLSAKLSHISYDLAQHRSIGYVAARILLLCPSFVLRWTTTFRRHLSTCHLQFNQLANQPIPSFQRRRRATFPRRKHRGLSSHGPYWVLLTLTLTLPSKTEARHWSRWPGLG
ncbi:hypothetical protein NEUTE2DRAFT_154843, partial [Neurospora tetrasperma FGSC 2509]